MSQKDPSLELLVLLVQAKPNEVVRRSQKNWKNYIKKTLSPKFADRRKEQ
jgi:hypothetical protein